MRNRSCLMLGLFVFATIAAFAQNARTAQVDVTYTGSGTVDASHKIYVALWDTADFNSGPPAQTKSIDTKKGTVTFTIGDSAVYASVAYDPTGKWDAQSPPPSGTSLGMYTVDPPHPAPFHAAPGKTVKVKIAFDDSIKVP